VFALGFATLYASRFIVPERLYPWLSLSSGAVVLGLGAVLIIARVRALLRSRRGHESHAHTHDHSHSHDAPQSISLRGLLALGITGGLLPCPSALVVLLGAISLHRVGLGLLLVVAFSAGLAAVLTGIGLALVVARRLLGRVREARALSASRAVRLAGRLAPALPAVSAIAVSAVGLVMTLRALDGVLG
jgi:ABC-type nickel/cobalt efflux system permease component RcnA